MATRPFAQRVLLASTLGVAGFLRLFQLGRPGLWTDECSTATWAALPLRGLLRQLAADCHPPLYYLLEKSVLAVSGTGEVAVRLVSAGAGLATVGDSFRRRSGDSAS